MLRQVVQQLVRHVETKVGAVGGRRGIYTTQRLRQEDKGKVTNVYVLSTEKSETQPPPPDRSILVDKDKNITMIGINRPQHRNAINSSTAVKLCDAFNAFEADETSPVAVLYGVGGSFCSGFDIFELSTDKSEDISIDILMTHEGSVGPTRRHISKPVICGINGFCVANGLELALMCDLRVMEETAILGFFNRRFGVPVIDGGTARLPAMIGFSRALDLILTGRQVAATEAHQMGIANRIVPTGSALVKAMELAHTLAKFPQGALKHDRNSLYSNVFEASNFNQAVQNEIMYTSKEIIDEMQNGIKWFNKTFKSDTAAYWLKRERSMADWDDEEVAAAAAKVEEEKAAAEVARIEAEKLLKSKEKKVIVEEPPKSAEKK